MTLNVYAGGDDRDQVYYENLDEELAAFEAQLAEDLANNEALEAFQQKLADEKAAAAKSNAACQSKLANDACCTSIVPLNEPVSEPVNEPLKSAYADDACVIEPENIGLCIIIYIYMLFVIGININIFPFRV